MKPPPRSARAGCLLFVALALFPILFLPFWPFSATWGWWPLFWVLAVLFILAWPGWKYSRAYGYLPSAVIGTAALILLVLLLIRAI